jgi:hypothetical protein
VPSIRSSPSFALSRKMRLPRVPNLVPRIFLIADLAADAAASTARLASATAALPAEVSLTPRSFTSRGDRPGIYDRNKALQRMQRRHPEKSIPAPQIMNNTLGSLFRRRSRIQASEPCSSCVGLADLPYVDGLGQSPRPGVRPRHRRARTAASRTALLSFGARAASSSYDDLGRLPGSGVIRPGPGQIPADRGL